jgi:hypothetical protein
MTDYKGVDMTDLTEDDPSREVRRQHVLDALRKASQPRDAWVAEDSPPGWVTLDGSFNLDILGAALRDQPLPKGSVFNPHTSRDAPRNPDLPINYWFYAGDEPPAEGAERDEWHRATAAEGSE